MNQLEKFIDEINKTNSLNEKQNILKKYKSNEFITKILIYTYDPMIQFGVSSANIKKYTKNKNYTEQEFKKCNDIFDILDNLNNKTITGNEALKTINEYIKQFNDNQKEIILNILDKNIKIRIGEKVINKVYERNIIPVFDPVLAKDYDPHFVKLDKNWLISIKYDGVRCLINVNPKNKIIKAYSRSGKELFNLECILDSIPINEFNENVFLDGEVVYTIDPEYEYKQNTNENFTRAIEIVRKSKTETDTSNLYYKIFDIIPEKDFFDGKGTIKLSDRYKQINKIFNKNKKIKIVNQMVYSEENFKLMNDNVQKYNWEGLMLRADTSYKGGRHRELNKVKTFCDEEFIVKRIETGPVRIIENKLETTIECMTSVIIDVNGKEVGVGSGFSIDERKYFYKNPKEIIGKNITVKYFEKTEDNSLRFPIYKGIREDI